MSGELLFYCALTFFVGMASTSGDATPPSPKITRLMAEMIKLGDHMRRMSYDNYERMERMRKENKESLGRIHRSREALSVRIKNIERRREDRSFNSSHGEDEGGRRNERYRERRNHRRYGGRQREERIKGVKVKIPTFKGTCDPKVYLEWEMKVEQVFACYNYNEEKKIKLASLEFEGYTLVWWNQVRSDVERMRRPLINT